MDWYDATERYHEQTLSHGGRLSSLHEDWQREMAAIWRLEAEVNNGAYLQFVLNWGRESYVYASQGLKRTGAEKMARIVDACQALVDEHFDFETKRDEQRRELMPNPVIDRDGNLVKRGGSVLPETVLQRLYELSYEFMEYPDDLAELGIQHYAAYVDDDDSSRTNG